MGFGVDFDDFDWDGVASVVGGVVGVAAAEGVVQDAFDSWDAEAVAEDLPPYCYTFPCDYDYHGGSHSEDCSYD